jgi:uncharacterized protein (TIGR03435 family)
MRCASLPLIAILSGSVVAQIERRPAFDVAAIKRASPDERGGGYRFEPSGRTIVSNFTLKNLIMVAWHIQDFQIAGGAGWLDSERYDVQAKAEGNPGEGESRAMLQSLMADRFHLAQHREAREMPIYVLALENRSGRLGAGLVTAKGGNCTPPVGEFPPPLEKGAPPYCGFKQRLRSQDKSAPLMQLQGSGVTLEMLARILGTILDRHIANETGISGNFDVNLEYAPDNNLLTHTLPETQPPDAAAPSLFTALREQLGLKLIPSKGPVEVLVIDHAERPSEN